MFRLMQPFRLTNTFVMILDAKSKFDRSLSLGYARWRASTLLARGFVIRPHHTLPDLFGVFQVTTRKRRNLPDVTETELIYQVQLFRNAERGYAFDHYECNCSSSCGLRCEHGEALLMIYANFGALIHSMDRIPLVNWSEQIISPRQHQVDGAIQSASVEDFIWIEANERAITTWGKPHKAGGS